MRKSLFFICIQLVCLSAYAQSISSFSPSNVCLGALQETQVYFNGTFGATNQFKIQLRNGSTNEIVGEVPATLNNGKIQARYTDSTWSTIGYFQGRLVSSSPVSTSDWYSFSILRKGFINVTAVSPDTLNYGDYLSLNFSGNSNSYVWVTMSDSSKLTNEYYGYSNFSFNKSFAIYAPGTLSIVRAVNSCGAMQVAGSGGVPLALNSTSIKTTDIFPRDLCVGSEIKVLFSTSGAALPAQTGYKLRLREVLESNDRIARSLDVNAELKDNALIAHLPNSLNITEKTKFVVHVLTDNPKLIGGAGNPFCYVYPKSDVTFISESETLDLGQSFAIGVQFTGLPPFKVDLGNNVIITEYYPEQQWARVSPDVTTSYVLKELSSGCGLSAPISKTQTVVATIKPGIAIVAENVSQGLCVGTPVKLRFRSNVPMTEATTYTINAETNNGKVYSFAAVRNGDYLEFQIPFDTEGNKSYDKIYSVYATTTNPSFTSPKLNGQLVVKIPPSMENMSSNTLEIDSPRMVALSYNLKGKGPYEIETNEGGIYRTSESFAFWDEYFSQTKDYKIKSIRNSCFKTENPVSTLVTLNSTNKTGVYIVNTRQVLCEQGDSLEVTILTTGAFGTGNEFAIQGRTDCCNFQTLKTVQGPGTYKVKMMLDNISSPSANIKVVSSNPVVMAEESFSTIHKPWNVVLHTATTSENPLEVFSTDSVAIYVSYYGSTPSSLVYSNGKEDKTVTLENYHTFYVKPVMGQTIPYTIKSVSNYCGTSTSNATTYIKAGVYSIKMLDELEDNFIVCPGGTINVPFYIYGGSAGNATFSLEIASKTDNVFSTIATTTNQLSISGSVGTARLAGDYLLRVRSSDGIISSPLTIRIAAAPTARLYTDLPTPILVEAQGAMPLKLEFTGTAPWNAIYSNNRQIYTATNPLTDQVYPNKGETYSLKTVFNTCGYGSVSGNVSFKVKPSFSVQSFDQPVCEGQKISIQYELRGDADLSNDYIRFELVDAELKTIPLDSTRIISGKIELTIPSGLTGSYYNLKSSVRSLNFQYYSYLNITAKPNLTIRGGTIINSGESASILIRNASASAGGTFYEFSNGEKGEFYGLSSTILVFPTQSTVYELVSASNACGAGSAAGSFIVEVNPPSERSIAVTDWMASSSTAFCMADTIRVNFSTKGTFSPGNTMTVQLSDTTGRTFKSIPTLGTTSPLKAVMPADLVEGQIYSVRVIASDAGTSSSVSQKPLPAYRKAKARFETTTVFLTQQSSPKAIVLLEGSAPWSYSYRSDKAGYTNYTVSSRDTINLKDAIPNESYRLLAVSNQCGRGLLESPSSLRVELITGEVEESAYITIAPNPVQDFVYLKFADVLSRNVTLFTIQGVSILSQLTKEKECSIDFRSLSSGIYLIKVDQKGKSLTYKVIKN